MKKLKPLTISVTALVVALSYLGACGKESSLHPQGGDGGDAGGGGNGSGGMGGTGGSPPGAGGYVGDGGFNGPGGYGTGGSPPPGAGGYVGDGGFNGAGGYGTGGEPAPCAQAGTQAACDANPWCYSVFFDPHNCACAGLGCCARFDHCALGAGAQCYGGVSCALTPPFCEGPYVVSYRGDCFEGCVNNPDCAPVCTPGADQTCNDNPIVSSFHGHCTDAGTCQCNAQFILNPNTGRCL
jgi:hypothetical protein